MDGEKLVASPFDARVKTIGLAAILPLVALAVVPALDSPFLAAKTGVLLLAGTLAAMFLARAESAGIAHADNETRLVRFAAFAWCAIVCVSLLHARDWAEAWPVLAPIAAASCLFLALVRVRVRTEILLAAIALAAVCVALLALAGRAGFDLPRILTGTPAPGRMRAAATLGNPMFVASFLAASFWSVFSFERVGRVWRWAAAGAIFAGMAATAERTAVLAFTFGAVVYLASSFDSALRRRALRACAVMLAAAILFGAALVGNPRSLDTALRGRIFLWSTALRRVTLLGAGPGSFYRVYNVNLLAEASAMPETAFRFVRYETDAHSIAVQSLAETGVAGFLALAAAFALWFRIAWKRRKSIAARCALAGVSAFLAAGLVDDPFARPEGLALLAFLLALPLLCVESRGTISAQPRLASRRADLAATFAFCGEGRNLSAVAEACIFAFFAISLTCAAGGTLFASYAVAAGASAEGRADWSAAERWNRAALTADPASRDARFNLSRVLCESNQFAECYAESDRALAWVNEAELHLIRVRALEMLGHASMAQSELENARRQFPWSEDLQTEQIENWTDVPTTQPIVVELNSTRSEP